ncbi:MAG: sigma factor-like helix-turn-helix DNA-binding protein [Bacteroides sp.]
MTNEERQTKIKWLMRYRFSEKHIRRLEQEKERWRDRATNTTTAPTYFNYITDPDKKSKMTPQKRRQNAMAPVVIRGGKSLSLEDIVGEIDALEREIQQNIYKSTAMRRDIGRAIDALVDDREQLVLYYKYVDGLYLEEICVRMGYSYQHTCRIHNKALVNLKMSNNEQ